MSDSLVIAAVFVVIGLAAIFSSCLVYQDEKQYRDWEIADAVVTHSEIKSTSARTQSSGVVYPTWEINIEYEYVIKQVKYTGNRLENRGQVYFSDGNESEPSDEKLLKQFSKYPKGEKIRIYYNPSNPSESIAELKESIFLLVLFSGMFLLVFSPLVIIIAGNS